LARLTRQVTDARGRFVFRNLAAGDGYTLQGVRPGYAIGAYGQSALFGPTARISLAEGQWFPSADFSLWRPAAISGRVLDEGNEPVVGVFVRALARVTIAGAPQLLAGPAVKTDDRGDYRIAGLGPGDYVIVVPAPSATVASDAPPRVLGMPAAAPRADGFSMPVQSRTDAVMAPVNGHHRVVGNYVTPPPAADGRPRAYGLTFHPGVPTVDAASSVSVALGDERTGVDVTLQPRPAVNVVGRATGPPDAMTSLLLRLVPAGLEGLAYGAEVATSLVRADGAFAFLHVPAGEYVIDAPSTTLEFTMESAGPSQSLPTPPGARVTGSQSRSLPAGPPGSSFVRRSGPRSDAYWARAPISVGAEDLLDVLVELSPSITLRGRIEYEGTARTTVEQTPVGGIVGVGRATSTQTTSTTITPRPGTMPFIVAEPAFGLAALGMPRAERPAADDPQDRPVITGLRAGEYVIRVSSGADRYTMRSVTVDGVDYTRKPVDTSVLRADSELVITLTDKLTAVRGSVSDERGPATEGVVLAFPAERSEWRGYGLTPLRLQSSPVAGATFELKGLPAGDYFVVAVSAADARAWPDPAFLEKASAVASRLSLAWGEERPLDLRLVRLP
jgi:hypothetical protein